MYPTFVRINGKFLDTPEYWSPVVTGDWRTDNETGRRYADEAAVYMSRNPTVLGHIVKAIVGNGNWTGVEVGFFHQISGMLPT